MGFKRSRVARFLEGVRTPFVGLAYLRRHRDLWHFALLPMLINLALTVTLLVGLIAASSAAFSFLHTLPYFAGATAGRLQEMFLWVLVVAVLIACTVAAYLFLSGIFSGLLNQRLAVAVERKLGTAAGELHPTTLGYQVLDSFRDLAAMLGIAAVSLGVGCIPVIGAVVGPVLSVYVDCRVLGFDYLDIPMALRNLPTREKRAFAKGHRAEQMGIGAAAFVLNLVPIVGSVLLTTMTIGAVLLYHRLTEKDSHDDVVVASATVR